MNSATSRVTVEEGLWGARTRSQVGCHAKRGCFGCFPLAILLTLLSISCASIPTDYTLYSGYGNDEAQGPWTRFPGVALSKADLEPRGIEGMLSIQLLKAMAEELLRLDGAAQCDPVSHHPIPNLSTEYCSAPYVVNTAQNEEHPQFELRLTIPRRNLVNPERSCFPPKGVRDADFPARWATIIGLIHNHPCGHGPSTQDISTWPVDFDPTPGMARLDLYPGNGVSGAPPTIQGTPAHRAELHLLEEGGPHHSSAPTDDRGRPRMEWARVGVACKVRAGSLGKWSSPVQPTIQASWRVMPRTLRSSSCV